MERVALDFEKEISEDEEEISVRVNFRCHINSFMAFYPMEVMGSIHEGHSLQQFIQSGIEHYQKEGYVKVEAVDVFIDS